MSDLKIFNKNLQNACDWMSLFEEYADWPEKNEEQACAVIRVALHELRDNLPINDWAHLSAQLTIFIRGILFENWVPSVSPLKERKKSEFLASIEENLSEIEKLKCITHRRIKELLP